LALGLTALAPYTLAQNGPTCDTYTNKTTADGLGSNGVLDVYAVGSTVYAATADGLSISTDGGTSFVNKTTADGLGSNRVRGVYAVGSTVYAATEGGLSFCSSAALPVTLRYFSGRMTDAGALLGWQTATETNNARFSIERSQNASSFESIATIPTQAQGGNSVTELTYSYLDTAPLPDINYYRLVQTDRDGTATRSKIIALSREDALVPVLYPNPVSASGEAVLEPAVSHSGYQLTDVLGRVVQRVDASGVLGRVSLAGLPVGVYVLTVQTESGPKTFRVVR
jgi:hypothetical protein